MLDLWASVKRSRDQAPRDGEGDAGREKPPGAGAPAAIAPTAVPAE